ncbi:type II secretion protein [Vibrio vulnificus]|uniref:AAA family ATPase n=1 Tax=Vibrio vulnificus TaxID=672 RepID=UPI000CD14158|nr:type II secretion protein [Vibrio vulnificus]EGR0106797.1 type II secretion protein [Vibrio vulnificus]EHV9834709.1 type II secretion protein [Vibrio vulnificus]EJE8691800.1 type II secretion protein [Vibrio vulnificus]POB17211.1 type II secretion protein [Vibrio vulnificus]HAS6019656.1 type II secretion protein [Vibrio vulnificus]
MMDLDVLFKSSSSHKNRASVNKDLIVSDDLEFLSSVDELYAIEGFESPIHAADLSEESILGRRDVSIKNIILDMRNNQNMVDEISDIATRLDVSIKLLVVSNFDSIKLRDRVQSCGASYILWDEELDGLLASLKRDIAEVSKSGKTRIAKRVLILGTKGGIGVSCISSVLANALVKNANLKTLVVDHDSGAMNGDIFLGVKGYKIKENSIDLNQSEIDSAIATTYLCKVTEKLDYLALEKTAACLSDHASTLFSLSSELVDKYNFIIDSVPMSSFEEVHDQDLSDKYHRIYLVCEPSVSSLRAYNRFKKKIGKAEHQVIFSQTRPNKDYLVTLKNAKERIKCHSSVDFAYEPGLEQKLIQLGTNGLMKSKYAGSISEMVASLTGKQIQAKNAKKFLLFKK